MVKIVKIEGGAVAYKEMSVAEFLGLSVEEQKIVDLRAAVVLGIQRRRKLAKLTQQELAEKIGSSQSRINKIENGAEGSLDLLFKAFYALGGANAEVFNGERIPPP